MRLLLGMHLQKALNNYEVSVPKDFPTDLLSESIAFCGDFIADMEADKEGLDKKIKDYFLSERFMEESETASFQFHKREQEGADLWLLMTYDDEQNVHLEVAENIKFSS